MEQYNKLYKLIIIGDSNVGKSSIMFQFVENKIPVNLSATLGIDFKTKLMKIENKYYKLQIWDTAGQEKFSHLNKNFYSDSDAVWLVYSNDNYQSFKRVEKWMNEARDNSHKNPLFYLICNKNDLGKDPIFKEGEEKIFAEKNDFKLFSVSAVTNSNLELLFKSITIDLNNKSHNDIKQTDNDISGIDIKKPKKPKKKCC